MLGDHRGQHLRRLHEHPRLKSPRGTFAYSLAAHVQISDLGCGLDAKTLKKATHPFFSAKPAGRQRGMGLADAARLIHLNGGTLTLASEPEKGTTVTVTLPYE